MLQASAAPKSPSQTQPPPVWVQSSSARASRDKRVSLLRSSRLATPSPRANDSLPESCTRGLGAPLRIFEAPPSSVPVARASRGNDGRHRPKVRGDGDMDCRRRVCYRDYHLHRVSPSIQWAVLSASHHFGRLTLCYPARYGSKRTTPSSLFFDDDVMRVQVLTAAQQELSEAASAAIRRSHPVDVWTSDPPR